MSFYGFLLRVHLRVPLRVVLEGSFNVFFFFFFCMGSFKGSFILRAPSKVCLGFMGSVGAESGLEFRVSGFLYRVLQGAGFVV